MTTCCYSLSFVVTRCTIVCLFKSDQRKCAKLISMVSCVKKDHLLNGQQIVRSIVSAVSFIFSYFLNTAFGLSRTKTFSILNSFRPISTEASFLDSFLPNNKMDYTHVSVLQVIAESRTLRGKCQIFNNFSGDRFFTGQGDK